MKSHVVSHSIFRIVLLTVLLAVLSSCSAISFREEKSSGATSTNLISVTETSEATPTPVPTYAPGTELYGMLSVTGEVVIEPKYEYLDLFSEEGLARFCDHGLWGYVNLEGKEVIPAHYEDANNFSEGLAAVKIDGLYGFIDVSGEMMIEPQFMGVQEGFLYDRCAVIAGNKIGLIDRSGKRIVETQYIAISLYCENYFIFIDHQGLYGIIDRDGHEMIDRVQSEIYAVTDSGYYFVRDSDMEYQDLMIDFEGNQYYVDVFFPNYPIYQIHSNSIIGFSTDGENWGLIDLEDGSIVIEEQFDNVVLFPGETFAYTNSGSKYGLVNALTGESILDCEYKGLSVEYEYISFKASNDKWGVMDLEGNTVLEPIYGDIQCSPFGEFVISYDGGSAIVDPEGNVLHRFTEYTINNNFIDSIDCWQVMRVDDDDYNNPLLGYMNRDGSILIEPSIELLDSPIPFRLLYDFNNYPSPLNPETYPLIAPYYFDDGKRANVIINSYGYVLDYPLKNFTWLPYKDIIVFTNEGGLEGILSYDGQLILEPSEYSFVLNDIYDDSDFLVFTTEK